MAARVSSFIHNVSNMQLHLKLALYWINYSERETRQGKSTRYPKNPITASITSTSDRFKRTVYAFSIKKKSKGTKWSISPERIYKMHKRSSATKLRLQLRRRRGRQTHQQMNRIMEHQRRGAAKTNSVQSHTKRVHLI